MNSIERLRNNGQYANRTCIMSKAPAHSKRTGFQRILPAMENGKWPHSATNRQTSSCCIERSVTSSLPTCFSTSLLLVSPLYNPCIVECSLATAMATATMTAMKSLFKSLSYFYTMQLPSNIPLYLLPSRKLRSSRLILCPSLIISKGSTQASYKSPCSVYHLWEWFMSPKR